MIQEELLQDFSNNSELSNWLGREDLNPPAVVVKKPNPRNLQNTDKIKELEEHIQKYVYHQELSRVYRTNELPDYTKKDNLSMRFFDSQRSQPLRLNLNLTTYTKISKLHVNHNAKKSTPLSSIPHNKPY